MSKSLSKKDLELLSAYIDGELDTQLQENIENRLGRDQNFQNSLDKLLIAKRILRYTPLIRIPRNFILSFDMLNIAPIQFRWQGAMRLTSTLATLLLATVIVSDIYIFNSPLTSSQSAVMQNDEQVEEMAVPAEETQDESAQAFSEKIEEPASPNSTASNTDSEPEEETDILSDSDRSVVGNDDIEGSDPPEDYGLEDKNEEEDNSSVAIQSSPLPTQGQPELSADESEVLDNTATDQLLPTEDIVEDYSEELPSEDQRGVVAWFFENIRIIEGTLIVIVIISWLFLFYLKRRINQK